MKTKKKFRRIATIDIGSNAIKFKQFRVRSKKSLYPLELDTFKRIDLRLGEDVFKNNKISEASEKRLIKELKSFKIIRPEKKFGKDTRFDFFLYNNKTDKKAFLEVKSVSLQRKIKHAEFPDSVTSRGKKHLENLISAYEQGYESYLMFLIQIEKCKSFSIASDIDPEYYEVFNNAIKKNVNVLCYDCKFSNKGIEINKKINLLNE